MENRWKVDFVGSLFLVLHTKLKLVKNALVKGSNQEFGNIFVQVTTLEDVIRVKEAQLEITPSSENSVELNRLQAKLRKYLKMEEDFWKQKVGMKSFRKKLQIREI